MKTRERCGQFFIIFCKSAKASGPSKGTFNHPSSGQKDKSLFCFFKFDHHQLDSLLCSLFRRFFAGVTLIYKCYFHVLAGNFLLVFDQITNLRPFLGKAMDSSGIKTYWKSEHKNTAFNGINPFPSQQTLHGLDWLNFFLADVQTGVGPCDCRSHAGFGPI